MAWDTVPAPNYAAFQSDAIRNALSNLVGNYQASQQGEQRTRANDLRNQEDQMLLTQQLAEMPCGTDADFIAKIAYLLRHEQRLWGETLRIYDGQYGALAFAVKLHLEERDEGRAA
jgi:hypothetical protein